MLLPSYNPYLQVTQVHLCTDFALSSRAGSPTAPQTGSLRQPIWAALDVGKAAGDVLGEVAKDTANPDGCAVCICKCRHRCSARGARRCQLSLAGSTRANPSSTQKIPLVNFWKLMNLRPFSCWFAAVSQVFLREEISAELKTRGEPTAVGP